MGSIRVEHSDCLARPTKQRGRGEKKEDGGRRKMGKRRRCSRRESEDRTLTPLLLAPTGPRRAAAGVPGPCRHPL